VGGFHDPIRFGHVVLSPTAADWARLEPELRKGGRKGFLDAPGREGGARDACVRLVEKGLRECGAFLKELQAVASKDTDKALRRDVEALAARFGKLRMRCRGLASQDMSALSALPSAINKLKMAIKEQVYQARLAVLLKSI